MQIIGDRNVRLIPDILVGGSNGSSNGLVDGLLSLILWNQTAKPGEALPTPLHPQPIVKPETSANGQSNIPPIVVDFTGDK